MSSKDFKKEGCSNVRDSALSHTHLSKHALCSPRTPYVLRRYDQAFNRAVEEYFSSCDSVAASSINADDSPGAASSVHIELAHLGLLFIAAGALTTVRSHIVRNAGSA